MQALPRDPIRMNMDASNSLIIIPSMDASYMQGVSAQDWHTGEEDALGLGRTLNQALAMMSYFAWSTQCLLQLRKVFKNLSG